MLPRMAHSEPISSIYQQFRPIFRPEVAWHPEHDAIKRLKVSRRGRQVGDYRFETFSESRNSPGSLAAVIIPSSRHIHVARFE